MKNNGFPEINPLAATAGADSKQFGAEIISSGGASSSHAKKKKKKKVKKQVLMSSERRDEAEI